MRFELSPSPAIINPLIRLGGFAPLVDGKIATQEPPHVDTSGPGTELSWGLPEGRFVLNVAPHEIEPGHTGLILRYRIEGRPEGNLLDSIGLHIKEIGNLRSYLRNGYTSWDGSFYVEPEALRGMDLVDGRMRQGFGMTQLLPRTGEGSAVIGFLRHDRFQHRFRFGLDEYPMTLSIETLWDRIEAGNGIEGEPLIIFAHDEVENALRIWARQVAEHAKLAPRVSQERITGWCSWYNLYGAIDEANLRDHLNGARQAKMGGMPLRIFQIDDGFTPEMGDWLDVKPQFPRGIPALLRDIREAGFTPGLWIAPFLVGNRSRLFREHPDWVVRNCTADEPLTVMNFYGEFRWFKRSEEYYVLDVTHPEAEAYIRNVFSIWAKDWGCEYFKVDFMYVGAEHGPDRVKWHTPGLTRMDVFTRMLRLIREEIGEAWLIGCGCPLLPSIGYVDGMRIGRDVGVSWGGHYSAESLLRDQATRNFTHGIFWQADPDCVLLRDRFHHLSDHEIEALAIYAGLAGGIAMTSDHLGEVSERRNELWGALLGQGRLGGCNYPMLGQAPIRYRPGRAHDGSPALIAEGDPVIVQRTNSAAGENGFQTMVNLFNTGDSPVERFYSWKQLGVTRPIHVSMCFGMDPVIVDEQGIHAMLRPHEARVISLRL